MEIRAEEKSCRDLKYPSSAWRVFSFLRLTAALFVHVFVHPTICHPSVRLSVCSSTHYLFRNSKENTYMQRGKMQLLLLFNLSILFKLPFPFLPFFQHGCMFLMGDCTQNASLPTQCDGLTQCDIKVAKIARIADKCGLWWRAYLQVEYSCVKG